MENPSIPGIVPKAILQGLVSTVPCCRRTRKLSDEFVWKALQLNIFLHQSKRNSLLVLRPAHHEVGLAENFLLECVHILVQLGMCQEHHFAENVFLKFAWLPPHLGVLDLLRKHVELGHAHVLLPAMPKATASPAKVAKTMADSPSAVNRSPAAI